jgi:hypothetical protein
MGKLNNYRCYLFGAIDKAPDRGYGWRLEISDFLLRLNIKPYNPLANDGNTSTQAEQRAEWKRLGHWHKFIPWMMDIRKNDYGMLDRCDMAIGYLNMDIPTCGSYMELERLANQEKPRLIVCPQGWEFVPDAAYWNIPVEWVFPSFDSLQYYLISIDAGLQYPLWDKFLYFG